MNTWHPSLFTIRETEQISEPTYSVSHNESSGRPPIKVPIDVNGVLLTMELDTGAAFSVLSCKDYINGLHIYGGMCLDVVGEIIVDVTYKRHTVKLPIVVVHAEEYTSPLLG